MFRFDSCQRILWIGDEAAASTLALLMDLPLQTFAGEEGYRFLLSVATGLESEILGETDVFGQLKEAWRAWEPGESELRSELAPWMQRLFEDSKEIRTRHLHHLGGVSYGSLVRMLLKLKSTVDGPILIVGAGQIARSVAPYLSESELWLVNRSPERVRELEAVIRERNPQARIRTDFATEAEAWAAAAHAVICIPFEIEADRGRIAHWQASAGYVEGSRCIVHLGGLRQESGDWTRLAGFHCLDDLFELRRSQGEQRSLQIVMARRACAERSKLRSLGGSLSIPHGWEDLAVFA